MIRTTLKYSKIFRNFSNGFNIKDMQKQGRSIYMDYSATTPMDYRVLDKMLPYMTSFYGNPHSRSHMFGWEAEKAVENSRE